MTKIEKLKKIPNPAWYSMTVALLTLSICGIIAVCVIWCYANQLIYSYGIIIDGGSTSTKVFLYKWPEIASRTNGEVVQVVTSKIVPGISDFIDTPHEAVQGLESSLDEIIFPLIPDHLRNKSFVYLGATAGMRLVEHRNPQAMKLLFEAIEEYLLSTGLKLQNRLRDVKVISGSVEGVAAWITANYLKETLQRSKLSTAFIKKKTTYGALDLGGASTQITFVPNQSTIDFENNPIRLYGENYNVYSHSYLCYGKSQAEFRLLALLSKQWIENYKFNKTKWIVNNPCMLQGDKASYYLQNITTIPCISGKYARENFGYSVELPDFIKKENRTVTFLGTGNPDQCHTLVKKLFNRTVCQYKTCGFNNVFQPNITGKFIAFAGYAVVYKQLRVVYKAEPTGYDDFLLKSKNYCSRKVNKTTLPMTDKEREIENWRKWRCFGFLYVFELLTSLGFNSMNWNSLTFNNTINNANLGWSLGYMINKTSMIPIEKPVITLKLGSFVAILVTCLVIFALGCILAIVSYKLHHLKPITSKSSEVVNLKPKVTDVYDDLSNV